MFRYKIYFNKDHREAFKVFAANSEEEALQNAMNLFGCNKDFFKKVVLFTPCDFSEEILSNFTRPDGNPVQSLDELVKAVAYTYEISTDKALRGLKQGNFSIPEIQRALRICFKHSKTTESIKVVTNRILEGKSLKEALDPEEISFLKEIKDTLEKVNKDLKFKSLKDDRGNVMYSSVYAVPETPEKIQTTISYFARREGEVWGGEVKAQPIFGDPSKEVKTGDIFTAFIDSEDKLDKLPESFNSYFSSKVKELQVHWSHEEIFVEGQYSIYKEGSVYNLYKGPDIIKSSRDLQDLLDYVESLKQEG